MVAPLGGLAYIYIYTCIYIYVYIYIRIYIYGMTCDVGQRCIGVVFESSWSQGYFIGAIVVGDLIPVFFFLGLLGGRQTRLRLFFAEEDLTT